jgi:hypothetical protein
MTVLIVEIQLLYSLHYKWLSLSLDVYAEYDQHTMTSRQDRLLAVCVNVTVIRIRAYVFIESVSHTDRLYREE